MTTQSDSFDFTAMPWLKAAPISGWLNFGSHQIPLLCISRTAAMIFIYILHALFPRDACGRLILKTSINAACRLQPWRALLCWHTSLFTLPVAQGCRKCCSDFRSSWHHVSPKLDQMKGGIGTLGLLLIIAPRFFLFSFFFFLQRLQRNLFQSESTAMCLLVMMQHIQRRVDYCLWWSADRCAQVRYRSKSLSVITYSTLR